MSAEIVSRRSESRPGSREKRRGRSASSGRTGRSLSRKLRSSASNSQTAARAHPNSKTRGKRRILSCLTTTGTTSTTLRWTRAAKMLAPPTTRARKRTCERSSTWRNRSPRTDAVRNYLISWNLNTKKGILNDYDLICEINNS